LLRDLPLGASDGLEWDETEQGKELVSILGNNRIVAAAKLFSLLQRTAQLMDL